MSNHWEKKLYENFEIKASLKSLDGEFDLNFFAHSNDGKYVMKVMRIGCHADLINMQCAAIRLLEGKNLCTPEIIPTNSGADFASINDEKGNLRLVWVIKAKSGICYSGVEPRSEDFINDLGSKIGEIDNALKEYQNIFQEEVDSEILIKIKKEALNIMKIFKEFNPHLAGQLLEGLIPKFLKI